MTSLRDFPSALALLLVDAELRQEFRINPTVLADKLNLESAARSIFCQLPPEQLDRQAQGLVSKRCYEVRQLLPRTWANLGPDEALRLFHLFAPSYWPEGHHRHRQDALAYCEFLNQRRTQGLVRAEWNWLRFCESSHRWRIHFVRDLGIGNRRRAGFQLLYRRSNGPAWFVFVLPFPLG